MMITPSLLCLPFLVLLCVTGLVYGAKEWVTPIPNLEGSLAASVAHSTAIAVSSSDGVVLVVYRPTQRPTSKLLAAPVQRQSFERNGLKLYAIPRSTSRWSLLAPNCFCTMTGFSADVSHLMKVLAKRIVSHQVLFYQNLPLQKIVLSLSNLLQRAAQRDGGRPFGIQALLVGMDNGDFQLFTCDPTGLYRHFPKGRAIIGKNAESIATELRDGAFGASEAIHTCLNAISKAASKESTVVDFDAIDVLLLWRSDNGDCQAGEIDPAIVRQHCQDILKGATGTK